MSHNTMIPETEWSESAEERQQMLLSKINRLQHLAHRAKHVHMLTNEESITVIIEVDSRWRWLVDKLMPNHDWEETRVFEPRPLAVGIAYFGTCQEVAKELPDLEDIIMEKPSAGRYKCIVLNDGGGTVYEIEPIEQKMQ